MTTPSRFLSSFGRNRGRSLRAQQQRLMDELLPTMAVSLKEIAQIVDEDKSRAAVHQKHMGRLPAWAMQAAPASPSRVMHFAPSSLKGLQALPVAYVANVAAGAKERGVRIHRVLECVPAAAPMEEIARWVAYVAPDWSAEEQSRATHEVAALMAREAWLWQGERHREVSVAGNIEVGGAMLPFNGQIDLLIRTADEVMILDYKTSAQVPTRSVDVPLSYLLQLKAYRALVAQIYPDLRMRVGIVWTAAPCVMWLDEAVDAALFTKPEPLGKPERAA